MTSFESTMPVVGFQGLGIIETMMGFPDPDPRRLYEFFRGNIREMHGSLAVGKMVSFKPETFYDPTTKEFYNGVYVTAYISKGAQDSWEKVLDGTLSGFSIGGKIKESDNEVNKATGKTVSFIKDYELM